MKQSSAARQWQSQHQESGMRQGRGGPIRPPWAIFWTAFGLRAAAVLLGHTYRIRLDNAHFDFGFEAGRIARSLATGHGYGNPFNGASGPTAWLAPLYPLLVSLAFKVFGVYSHAAALSLMLLDSLFSALIAPAVYCIGELCFDRTGLARRASTRPHPVGWWAAWAWAVYPAAMQYAVHWIWEMSLTACLFTWAMVVALRLGFGIDRRSRSWCALGELWGLISLTNPSLLLVFPATLGWIGWLRRRSGGQLGDWARGTVLAAVIMGLLVLPWAIRNGRALGAFVPTRSNFGVELWQSTHFEAYQAFPWGTAMPLWPGDPEFRRFVAEGEVRYARAKQREALARIRAQPGQFVKYTLMRIEFFWIGTPHPSDRHPAGEIVRRLNYGLLSLLGLGGLGLALVRKVPGAGLLAWAFALVPLVYYGVTVQARFRHPLEPLIAVLGVYLVRSAD